MLDAVKEEKLKRKLVDLINYHSDLKGQKKAMNSSLGEQIKQAQKKIEAIGETIQHKDITKLQGAFEAPELDFLQ